MGKEEKNDTWKTIATTAIGCVVLMVSFWMVESKNYITRAEAVDMIKSLAPYNEDRQLISQSLSNLYDAMKSNTEVIAELRIEIARLRAELDKYERTETENIEEISVVTMGN
jgi:uncharacterized small protein (DUF1192 family)